MTAFVRAVDSGGFSAAARELGLTPSALSKLISRLEDRLGVRLLHRTTRRLHLTPEGEAFYQSARLILTAMDDAEAEVRANSAGPRGVLRLHCGSAFGVHQLTPAVPRFLARYPQMELDLHIGDQPLAALGEAFDLSIRVGTPEESTAVVRRIANLERVICATPDYLERNGTPCTPDDLQRHNCLWVANVPALRRWPFDTDDGVRIVNIDGNVVANSAETVLQLALAGVGMARLTDDIAGEAIGCGTLVPVLEAWHHAEPVPLYAAYPSNRHVSPKVRAMVDFLVEEFGTAPWRRRPPAADPLLQTYGVPP